MPTRPDRPVRNDASSPQDDRDQLRSRNRGEDYFGDKTTGGIDAFKIAQFESEDVGVLEVLEADTRPTFIIDLEVLDRSFKSLPLQPIFSNKTLRSSVALLDVILGRAAAELLGRHVTYKDYQAWAVMLGDHGPDTLLYGGLIWSRLTIRNRWRMISGSPCYENPGLSPEEQLAKSVSNVSIGSRGTASKGRQSSKDSSSLQQRSRDSSPAATSYFAPSPIGCPDWTAPKIKGQLSAHVQFTRNIDWSSTPLGPMESWSAEFRQIANLLMAAPHPGALFWGPDLTMMYNEAYRDGVAGLKHPQLMGTGFKGPFAELWDTVGGIMAECATTGKAVAMVDQMLPIERHGFLEETYFSWCFVPLYEGYTTPRGFWNAPFETTKQVTNSRRTQLLRDIAEEASLSKTIKEFWSNVLRALESNEFDVPFSLLYSVVDDDSESDSVSVSSAGSGTFQKSCVFEGSLGIPEGHPAAPKRLDLNRANEGFIPSFREAMTTREPTMLVSKDGTLPQSLLKGIEWRGFREPCREAVIFPVRPTNGESVVGFLLLGINPRRPYDDDYKSFVYMLDRQLATSIASVILFEDEIRAGRTAAEAAAIERANLSAQLEIQTRRLQRMTETSPVGMFYMDAAGLLLEANDRYYEITAHPRGAHKAFNLSWIECYSEDSRPIGLAGWHQLTVEGRPWSSELRLKKPWITENGEIRDYYVLAAAHPEFDSDGKVASVMGSLTNISSQKHLSEEALARARLSEELALRTQEAAKSERKFKRFSDLSPGGLVVMDSGGHITYANMQWFEISGHPNHAQAGQLMWQNVIHPEFLASTEDKWKQLYANQQPFTMDVRMKKPWITGTGSMGETWVLLSASPEVSADGKLTGTMACITDISHIKWAEGLQTRRLEEAEATRRQQNNFIDIVSHEMRNPIGAILGCADDLSGALLDIQPNSHSAKMLAQLISDCVESAETIALCAQHQKSIVDDILTISKLDSDLLLITPQAAQPFVVAQRAVKMFDAEFTKKDIAMEFSVDDSYAELDVDWVVLDPSRLLQILINLMTNAIKFTQSCPQRQISIHLSASVETPTNTSDIITYIPPKSATSTNSFGLTSDWGVGSFLYLKFEIHDTGCGLSVDEKKLLFQRFSQANPRTHQQYGGSGLGLFICRQLTEFHGGRIGVWSEAGVGSRFAFFIKVRKTEMPTALKGNRANSISKMAAQKFKDSSTVGNLAQPTEALEQTTDFHSNMDPGIDQVRAAEDDEGRRKEIDTTKLHILLVEDNLVNQKVLRKQLQKLGCTVAVACHGEEALAYLETTNIFAGNAKDAEALDLVLMDLEMPVMDGSTCVKKIREWEEEGRIRVSRYGEGRRGRLPVIAVTANVRGEQIEKAKKDGMDDVVGKPFRVPELIAKMKEVLGKYHDRG